MKKRLLMNNYFRLPCIFILFFALSGNLFSQIDFNDYSPLYCSGEIPSNLKRLSSEKAKMAISEIKSKKSKRRDRLQEEEHAIAANFLEDEILTSGQILYGDPMTLFVNKVADVLLSADPELRKKLNFFVLRSHIPNAYATSNGFVFVSIGLLSRLENESQLAVILAHEIQHFVLKHSLEQYKEIRNLSLKSKVDDLDESLESFYKFSRVQELEADDLGYQMVQKTNYDLSQGIYVFEMLRFAEYPFLESSLTIDSFESVNFKFPEKLKLNIRENIDKSEKQDLEDISKSAVDDSKSSHPSLNNRIILLKDKISRFDNSNKSTYLVGQVEFEHMQKVARYELLLLFVRRADYGRAFYLSRIMELLYENGLFLSKIKAQSLYAMMLHKQNNHKMIKYGCNIAENKGDWKAITTAFYEMDKLALGIFSTREIWKIKQLHPQNDYISELCDNIFQMLQQNSGNNFKHYINYKPYSEADLNDTLIVKQSKIENSNGKLKNPRQREEKVNVSTESNSGVYQSAFYDLQNFSKLVDYLKNLDRKYVDNEIKLASDNLNNKKTLKNMHFDSKENYKTLSPDFKGMVVFEPKLYTIKGGFFKEANTNLIKSEKSAIKLIKQWEDILSLINKNVFIVKNSVNIDLTTQKLNDYSQLNDWFIERMNNDEIEMNLYYTQYISTLMQTYNANYIYRVNYFYSVDRRPFNSDYLIASVLFPFTLPVYLNWQFSEEVVLKMNNIVCDIKDGKIVLNWTKDLTCKMDSDYSQAHIYDLIYEIVHLRTTNEK